jgi:hypothetical protein
LEKNLKTRLASLTFLIASALTSLAFAQTPPPAPMPAPSAPMASPPAASPITAPPAAPMVAPGGGPGMVWVNTKSHVYHCYGSKHYGTTKVGTYMSQSDAKAAGAHAAHGKLCP